MAVDTPAKIAVLGAGPIGLEAALYGRYLGYDVEIFERGDVAENVLRWGHLRMFSPFHMNSTTLGIAAIKAQDDHYEVPDADAFLTGRQWRDRYLVPLAQSDLLVDYLRLRTRVITVSRRDFLKQEKVDDEDREDSPLRVLLEDENGAERESFVDIVIDTTGTYAQPNWMGPGGAPAIGERNLRDRIRYDVPDILGADRERYANKRVLVVGHGHSAATNIVNLASLAEQGDAMRVSWATRRMNTETQGPIPEIADDPLPERIKLARAANLTLVSERSMVVHWPGTMVKSLKLDADGKAVRAEFQGQYAGVGEFDEVIASVGYRPDNSLYSELQVHECYASNGPMRLAAKLLGTAKEDCLKQTTHGPQSLVNPEPNFYILGAKSYGRHSNFLVSIGTQQIRELFSLIGDRADLDLYGSAKRLLERK